MPIHSIALYSSLPPDLRQRTLAELDKKSSENAKNNPVYLQVELAKTQPRQLPFSIVA